jgi:hypothetical protein
VALSAVYLAPSTASDYEDGGSGPGYTFTAADLGTAATDRYIIVAVHGRAGGARTCSTCTVQGISATKLAEGATGSGSSNTSSLWLVNVPTGATGDIVPEFTGSMARAAISVYQIDGLNPTPNDTASNNSAGTATINCPADGVVLGAASSGANNTLSWTGLTLDATTVLVEGSYLAYSVAANEYATLQDEITVDAAGGTSDFVGAWASFAEAAGGGPTPHPAGPFGSPFNGPFAGAFA